MTDNTVHNAPFRCPASTASTSPACAESMPARAILRMAASATFTVDHQFVPRPPQHLADALVVSAEVAAVNRRRRPMMTCPASIAREPYRLSPCIADHA